jgi:hypothetical protein
MSESLLYDPLAAAPAAAREDASRAAVSAGGVIGDGQHLDQGGEGGGVQARQVWCQGGQAGAQI